MAEKFMSNLQATYNKNQQSDSVSVSLFVHKDAQKLPSLLRSCGWRYAAERYEVIIIFNGNKFVAEHVRECSRNHCD